MSQYREEYKKYYPKLFATVLVLFAMSIYLITRNTKPKEEFIHQKGAISYLSENNPFSSTLEVKQKTIFLKLEQHNRIYELFTGTDKGDFSPRVNRLNELNIGNQVDIYFEENTKTKLDQTNKLLQYLYIDSELIYLRSNADKYIGYFTLGGSMLLFLIAVFMKIKST